MTPTFDMFLDSKSPSDDGDHRRVFRMVTIGMHFTTASFGGASRRLVVVAFGWKLTSDPGHNISTIDVDANPRNSGTSQFEHAELRRHQDPRRNMSTINVVAHPRNSGTSAG